MTVAGAECGFKQNHDTFLRDLLYAYVLTALKPESVQELMAPIPKILESSWFWAFIPNDCLQFLRELVPYLTIEERLSLLKAVATLENLENQPFTGGCLGYALPVLVPYLSQEHLPKALAAVKSITKWQDRKIDALAALAPRLSNELLFEALEILQLEFAQLPDDKYIKALSVLVPHLKTSSLLTKALAGVISFDFKDDSYRVKALTTLVPYTTEAVTKAAEYVFSLEQDRAETLAALSPYLAQVPEPSNLLQTALRSLSRNPRPDLLQDLAALVPFIFALGNQPTVELVAKLIQDVMRWWP